MTVVDRLSKYGHFIPLVSTFTTNTVTEAFVTQIIRLHGPPRNIVTLEFYIPFGKRSIRFQVTSLFMSTAYHPQKI